MTEASPGERRLTQAGSATTISPTASSANGQRSAAASDGVIESANTVIQELFAVGLDLTSSMKMIHGPAADRVAKAVDDLDAVIAHIRKAIFAQVRGGDGVLAHLLAADTAVDVDERRTSDSSLQPAALTAQHNDQETNMPTKRATKPKTVPITFTLPAEVEADEVALCGEFNDWSTDDIHLTRDGDGSWQTTVSLAPSRTYRYRYLLDRQRWENAWDADQYAPNPYGGDDSVIIVVD